MQFATNINIQATFLSLMNRNETPKYMYLKLTQHCHT